MELKTNDFKREMETSDFREAQNKELVFSVADEIPYLRRDQTFGDYYEVLEISENAIDTERLVRNMPFLKDHDHNVQLGAVKSFWIDNDSKKLYVSVKFSRSKFAQGIKEDIIDLIRQNTSIGYYVNQFQRTGQIDGIPVLRAISWTPYECSSVSVPASVYVGYNRSLEVKEQKGQDMNAQTDKTDSATELAVETAKVEETDLDREDQATVVEDLETKSEETTEVAKETEEKEVCPECGKEPCECEKSTEEADKEEKDCGGKMKPQEKQLEVVSKPIPVNEIPVDEVQIRSLGELTNNVELAEQFIAEKKSYQDFKNYLKTKNSEKSKNSIQDKMKMNKKYFSISKAIRNACSQYKGDISKDYETEVINENKRSFGVDDADIVLSNRELYQRAFPTSGIGGDGAILGPTATEGAELIKTDYLPQEFVSYLRPQLTLEKTGYYSIPVNGNAVSFAVCTSGSVAGMYNLDNELADGDMKFAIKTLTPHKAGVCIPVPYSLILQGRPEVDAMVEADVVNALYQKRDEQILVGTGADGQCSGILANSLINQVATPLSTAWAGCLSGVNAIRKNNIFSENLSFVMNGDTYVKLCTTMKNDKNCFAGFVIENDKIGNYPVYVNNAITAEDGKDIVLVGDFGEVAVADFEGLKLKVDDITYIKQNAIQIVAIKAFDCVVRRTGAFTKITIG